MQDIYKYAARFKLRFPSTRGDLTVEQLYQVPLRSASDFSLDNIAKGINAELKGVSEESFVPDESAKADPRKEMLEVSLAVVKDVIATKLEEGKAARIKLEKAEQRRKILDAMAAQKDKKLTEASLEELEKQLKELDD